MIDPTQLPDMSTADLCEAHENLSHEMEDLDAEKKAIRDEVLSRMKDDGELHGDFTVTRVKKTNWTGVKVEQVKALGAVKEAVDTAKLSKLYKSGAKLPVEPSIVIYPLIKRLEQPEE